MGHQILHSTDNDLHQAMVELKSQCEQEKTKLILYFCSILTYEPSVISRVLSENFPNTILVGSSCVGSLVEENCIQSSITLICFDEEEIEDCKIEIIENIDKKPAYDLKSSVKRLQHNLSSDIDEYFGLCLFDGLSLKERWLSKSLSLFSKNKFIGVAAADNLKFDNTFVFYNNKGFSNGALLLLVKPKNGFEIEEVQNENVIFANATSGEQKKEAINKINTERFRLVLQFSNIEYSLSKLSKKKGENNLFINDQDSSFFRINSYGNFYEKSINQTMINLKLK